MSHLTPLQLAGALARRADFHAWVSQYSVPPRAIDADAAAQFIRDACGVQSRRELATNSEAAHRLETLVRRPFIAWRENNQEQS
ncbi:hypothetical protein M3I54_22650 [Paraburkholderia sp. CNPSo 3274]|uniref:hypothetical protein n=1 Tax=Paraburkholderia sp. CNPSo 3274 TaxID=2940932 RepID=UPI0020B7128A|nr:hypothetical protein [Paraburkholderia sp. CNPSo 3274]MCP3709747.1 hypothetical protein [Paraburkholderia sp. CNPSo 3274]